MPETPLEIAVGVETERLEPGELCLLPGPPEHLEEVGQGRRKLANRRGNRDSLNRGRKICNKRKAFSRIVIIAPFSHP